MKAEFTFGEWLKRRRGGLGLTQKELAQQVGYAEVTLRKVEADELRPSRQMAEKLAEVLEIASDEQKRFVQFARDEGDCNDIPHSTPLASSVLVSSQKTPFLLHNGIQHRWLPLERPPRSPYFFGRKTELADLVSALQPGQVVTICGPGGIGKTALAAEAVWQLAPSHEPPHSFPDGILFHCFYNQPQVAFVLEHIARSFGEEPKPTPREAAQRVLASRQLLLILDGAEEADELNQLLDIHNQCAVLITSRRRSDAIAYRQDLAALSQNDAINVIQAWGGTRATDKIAVARISELVGGLPLALRLVGRFLQENEENAADYLAWLTKTPLAALEQGRRREESVPKLLERSLAQVSENARLVIGVIGVLALAPFARAPINTALELSDLNTSKALGELVKYGLLIRPDDAYEVTHALIHTYARTQLLPSLKTIERLAVYYTALAEKHASDFALMKRIRPHIMALLNIGRERKTWFSINNLVLAIEHYLDLQGYWNDRIVAMEASLDALQALQNKENEDVWLNNLWQMHRELGWTYRGLGHVKQAIGHSRQALTITRKLGNRFGESKCLGVLGVVHAEIGETQQAIEYFHQALAIDQAIGDRQGEGDQLGNLGNIYYFVGHMEQAIKFHQQALVIYQEVGKRRGIGHTLGNLGLAYTALGQIEDAIRFCQQALTIAEEIGDRRSEGEQLGNLGLAYAALGQVEQAIRLYQQSLTIAEEIGDRRNEGELLGNLGLANAALGQAEQAGMFYQRALTVAKETGNLRVEIISLNNLGQWYHKSNRFEQALPCLEQALALSRKSGFRLIEGKILKDMGSTYHELGQIRRARQCWEEALDIFEDIKSPNSDIVRQWLQPLNA